jgi:hypothetical protein
VSDPAAFEQRLIVRGRVTGHGAAVTMFPPNTPTFIPRDNRLIGIIGLVSLSCFTCGIPLRRWTPSQRSHTLGLKYVDIINDSPTCKISPIAI